MTARIGAILALDAVRLHRLAVIATLGLPDCWIGAGFVRNAVWDHLHDRPPQSDPGDTDVVWFDPTSPTPEQDRRIEARLSAADPTTRWSVKNQARMHTRNGDAPYANTADAIAHWPETATAVAVRLVGRQVEVLAPLGLSDLFALVLRPTPAFSGKKLPIFHHRIAEKKWLERWPSLWVVTD